MKPWAWALFRLGDSFKPPEPQTNLPKPWAQWYPLSLTWRQPLLGGKGKDGREKKRESFSRQKNEVACKLWLSTYKAVKTSLLPGALSWLTNPLAMLYAGFCLHPRNGLYFAVFRILSSSLLLSYESITVHQSNKNTSEVFVRYFTPAKCPGGWKGKAV